MCALRTHVATLPRVFNPESRVNPAAEPLKHGGKKGKYINKPTPGEPSAAVLTSDTEESVHMLGFEPSAPLKIRPGVNSAKSHTHPGP